jgi:hypothetical protein
VNRRKLIWQIPVGVLAILALLCAVRNHFLFSGPRSLCHVALAAAFNQWMLDAGQTAGNGIYPNADGESSNSLALLRRYDSDDLQRYAYVPGLNVNDPRDLVLMYLKVKTHYTWHGDFEHTIYLPARWMVLSPQFYLRCDTCPEGGDLVGTPELKRRLLLTLQFLQEKRRGHWEVVSNEQMQFLKSIN